MTKRITDMNGWLEVKDNPITKTGIFPYLGREIGAPDADKIYYVLRPEEELTKQECIDSFKLIPFIDEHEMLGMDATPAERKGVQGMVGEQVYYDAPYLRGNLKVLSDSAQALIASGKIELSPGYRCRYEFEAGTFDGKKYDAIQRDLRANHLALVQEGRTGRDVSVQDRNSVFTLDTSELVNMNLTEIMEAIAALSDEEKAKLLASLAPGESATSDEEIDDLSDEEKAAAAFAAKTLEEVAVVAESAATAAAEAAASGDQGDAEEAAAAAEEVVAVAEEAEEEIDEAAAMDAMKKEIKRLQAALDSGAVMKSIASRDKLAKQVQKFVGVFDHSAMTAKQVASYGVKKLGIKCAAGTETVALDAWMQGRTPDSMKPSTAMDSRVSSNDIKSKWGK